MGPGECGRANVPLRWWQGDDERLHARFGLGQPDVVDGRRLEVIVDASLSSGAQLAVDTTLVCALSPPRRHTGGSCTTGRRRVAVRPPSEGTHIHPSCFLDEPVPSWLSSPWKWEAGGLKRRGCSCLCWPQPRFVARIHCCASGSSRLGVPGGVHCCPVPLLVQSRPHCWSTGSTWRRW